MENDIFGKKGKGEFNILSGDSTKGDGGFGVGVISLDNITPVIIDPQKKEVTIDIDALHARSQVERKVRFKPTKEGLGDANLYWIVWVATEVGKNGPYICGIAACEIQVSREERRIRPGYKSLPEHVNNLDKALKRKIIVDHMDDLSKQLLIDFLKTSHKDLWDNISDELKTALTN